MKKYQFFVGIDVSKSKLDIAILNTDNPEKIQFILIENNKKAIKAMIKKLPKNVLICFEHTGNYGLTLSYQLAESNIDFWIENPLLIRRFKGFKRGKTDKADAKDIANYALALKHKVKLYEIKEDDLLKIRLLLNQRNKLVKCRQMFKVNKESFSNYPKPIKKQVEKLNAKQIKLFSKQIKAVEAELKKVLAANNDLNDKVKLAKSVIGVGDQTALHMLVKTNAFLAFSDWRKFACYVGTAPFEYTSGSSIKGKAKISHYADKKMKALLSSAVISAKKYDPEIKQYYMRKMKEGKNERLVKNNIRNKLIARVFAVVERGTPFVNTQKHLS